MSFFMGSTSQYAFVEVDPEKLKLAEAQFTVVSLTFNRLLKTCHEKCIAHEYGESDLNTGEASCIDRCVAKYVKANAEVGQHVQFILKPEAMPEYQKVASMLVANHDRQTKG